METITFTIYKTNTGIRIKTTSLFADERDRNGIGFPYIASLNEMIKISKKYNKRGISVLFEVEE